LALLWQQAQMTKSLAQEMEPLLSSPVADGSRVAVATDSPYESNQVLMFSPYLWAGAHYARRAQGFLVNAPWLIPNLPITTFVARRPTPWGNKQPYELTQYVLRYPTHLPPATALVFWRTGFANGEKNRLPTMLGLERKVISGENLALYVK